MAGTAANSRTDFARLASGELSSACGSLAPSTLTAVRTTSIGCDANEVRSMAAFTSGASARPARSAVSNAANSLSEGSSPCHSSHATCSKEHFSASSCTGYPRYRSELVSGLTFETAVVSTTTPAKPLLMSVISISSLSQLLRLLLRSKVKMPSSKSEYPA